MMKVTWLHSKQFNIYFCAVSLNRDYRFSLCTIIFQSIFQGSLYWFRKTANVLHELDCLAVMYTPHDQWSSTWDRAASTINASSTCS
jgi:hypothetical protein